MNGFIALLMVIPSILAAHLHLNEISPEEAQKFFAEQNLDLTYAKKLGETPLSALRSESNRNFYFNGRKIDNPEDYVEETFEAEQFHGQDGLGRAMFGYTDTNQARLEARNANGDVRGSYQFVDADGENIVVQYWSDSLGFHQTDNRPKVILEPATDTPEVQAARLEHERLWAEAANLAKSNPDPLSDVYNRGAIAYDTQVESEVAESALSVSNQAQGLSRYPHLPYDQHISPGKAVSASDDSVVVDAVAESQIKERIDKQERSFAASETEEVEIPSVPRGFFYKFQYPVSVISETPSRRQSRKAAEESDSAHKVRRAVEPAVVTTDAKPVVVATQLKSESPVSPGQSRISLKATEEGAIPIDAVHDAQVHPNQRSGLVNSQTLPVSIHRE